MVILEGISFPPGVSDAIVLHTRSSVVSNMNDVNDADLEVYLPEKGTVCILNTPGQAQIQSLIKLWNTEPSTFRDLRRPHYSLSGMKSRYAQSSHPPVPSW